MGLIPLPLTVLLAAAPGIAMTVPAPSVPEQRTVPLAQEDFDAVLQQGDLPQLEQACRDSARFGANDRLQLLRDRLMQVAPARQSFSVVMANARALMACKAPDSAQVVLSRYGPGPGRQRREWLLLSWQAASAALDQTRAILALQRLAEGDPSRLEGEQLIVGVDSEGQALTRSGLDVLAQAQIASGQPEQAVITLLSARTQGVAAARRLGLAAELLDTMEPERSAPLLEAALDQAAAEQAWNQAEDLLRLQLRLELANGGSGERPRERLRRLANRLDDRLTLLELDRVLPEMSPGERQLLEEELRSPRAPGGHASLGESPAPPAGVRVPGVSNEP